MEIRAKNHDFSLGYGQYKSLCWDNFIHNQERTSSLYEGVEKPSPFPDSDAPTSRHPVTLSAY